MIQVGVVQFPGSNCERETRLAIERAGMRPMDLMWNAGPQEIERLDGYVIVGGFSYEDRGRSGLIAAKTPIMDKLAEEAQKGKPLLGICNGAQILVESGLVPGFKNREVAIALTHNLRINNNQVIGTGFYNNWCHVTAPHPGPVFGSYFKHPIHIPLAHAEGRFLLSEDLYQALQQAGASLWQYCDSDGQTPAHFPINPNGSSHNLAAISNFAGNVLAIMPHPERSLNGDGIFASMRNYIRQPKRSMANPDSFIPPYQLQPYRLAPGRQELIIGLSINDNEAVSIQKSLQLLGYPLQAKRYVHWELASPLDPVNLLAKLRESLALYNPKKEYIVSFQPKPDSRYLLVRERMDPFSVAIHARLQDLQLPITELKRGILWQLTGPDIVKASQMLCQQKFLFNPQAHDCYDYMGANL